MLSLVVPPGIIRTGSPSRNLNASHVELETEAISNSVSDLRDVLHRMTGANFEVKETTDFSGGIVLARRSDLGTLHLQTAEEALRITADGIDGREAFYVRTEAHRILIIGNDWFGVSHGVHAVLRLLGYRRFLPGKNWEAVPNRPMLELAAHFSDRPAFFIRSIGAAGGDGYFASPSVIEDRAAWERASFADGYSMQFRGIHSWQQLAETTSNGHPGYELLNAHPELVLGFGKSKARAGVPYTPEAIAKKSLPGYQFDVSNPTVRALFLDYARRELNAPRNQGALEATVALDPSDGDGWYLSDISRPNWYRQLGYSAPNWQGSVSDHVFGLANFVADQLARENPQRKVIVGLLAYNFHADPPHFPLSSNVRVSVAQAFCKRPDCATRNVSRWHQAEPSMPLQIYDYYSVGVWNQGDPPSSLTSTPARIKERLWSELYEKGVRGVYAEAQSDMALNGLAYYLHELGLWNPLADFAALRAEFLERCFGASAPTMNLYYDLLSPDRVAVPSFSTWSGAVSMLDKAAHIVRANGDSASERRLDELKYFWYGVYLRRKLDGAPKDPELARKYRELFFRQSNSYSLSWAVTRTDIQRRFNTWRVAQTPRVWKGSLEQSCPIDPSTGSPVECSEPSWTHYDYTQSEIDCWWPDVTAFFDEPGGDVKEYSSHLVPVDRVPGSEYAPHVSHGISLDAGKFDAWLYSFHGEPIELKVYNQTYPERSKHLSYTVYSDDGRALTSGRDLETQGTEPILLRQAVPSAGAFRVNITHDFLGFWAKPSPGYPIAITGRSEQSFHFFPSWRFGAAAFYVPTGSDQMKMEMAFSGSAPEFRAPDGHAFPVIFEKGSSKDGGIVRQATTARSGMWTVKCALPGGLELFYPFDTPNLLWNADGYPMVPREVATADRRPIRVAPVAAATVAVGVPATLPAGSKALPQKFVGAYEEVLAAPALPSEIAARAHDGIDGTGVFRNVTNQSIYILRTLPSRMVDGKYLDQALGPGWYVLFDTAAPNDGVYFARGRYDHDSILTESLPSSWFHLSSTPSPVAMTVELPSTR